MKNDISKLSSIKSKDILKIIFSNVQIIHILKLIKYNKNTQNRLGITKEAFEDNSDLPKLKTEKKTEITKRLMKRKKKLFNFEDLPRYLFNSCCYIIYFLYLFIYTIVLVSLDGFDGSNSKENSEDSIKTINILNACLFCLVALVIASYFLITFFILKITTDDVDCKRVIKFVILIFFVVAHVLFEALIIWKLVISYNIKSGDAPWFMKMDITFLVLNFLFIACLVLNICIYKSQTKPITEIKTTLTLKSLNNIVIEDYSLPINFNDFNRREKRKFIHSNLYSIRPISDPSVDYIIKCINDKRTKYGIKNLSKYNYKLLGFMGLLPSEAYFFEYKSVFQINYNLYLIWCTYEQLLEMVNKEEDDIMKIIKNDKLCYINIIKRKNDKKSFIYIWDVIRDNYDIKNPFNYNSDYYRNKNNKSEDTKLMIEMKNDLETNLIDK